MSLKMGIHNFEIHMTGEDIKVDTKLRAIPVAKIDYKFRKTLDGSDVRTKKIAIVPSGNEFMEKLKKDEDLRQEFMDEDNEIDLDITGKYIHRTSRLLFYETDTSKVCYSFHEYEIKRDRFDKVIPCETCHQIYCEHRLKKQTTPNINVEENPIRYIRQMTLSKTEAIKKWSFDRIYQIRHVDGLTYKFCHDLAKKLHDSGTLVLMAPIEENKVQKIVLRKGGIPFYGFLEGRVQGDKYALLLHRTVFRITD